MVHCLWAQQTDKLHSFRSDHGQRIHVPRLQWKLLWPERGAAPQQEHGCHCQDRCDIVCMYSTVCVCAFIVSIAFYTNIGCHISADLWGLTKFACTPTFLHRPGVQNKPLQGEERVLCAQVYSATGWQICSGRLQHCHQLRRQRLPQGKHAC